MNGRVARQLRKEQPEKEKQFTRPFLAMLPEGEFGPDGKRQLVPVHIPRPIRRKMLQKMRTDMKKGRLNARGPEQER
jgi:hypothetical protein